MKALILAAGYGERMGPLTKDLPKPLIPIANKPVIQHIIDNLYVSGIKDFIVAVGYLKDQLASFLYTFPGRDVSILIKEARNFEKGPIFTFHACMNEIKNEDFLLVPADLLIEPTIISQFLKETTGKAIAVAYDPVKITPQNTPIHLSKDKPNSGVLGINTNLSNMESQKRPLLPLLLCRIDLSPYILEAIKSNKTKVIDALEFCLHDGHKIFASKIGRQYWSEIDTIQDVLDANNYLLNQLAISNKPILISKLKKFKNLMFNMPILLGENCQIENNCTLGPNVSIGANSSLGENVMIQNAIVCPSSKVPANTKIQDAIFFKHSYSIK